MSDTSERIHVAAPRPARLPECAVREAITLPSRLEALATTGLMDSPTEEGFDRLARLVQTMLRTPVALISLVDADRQFFKSAVGLAEPWASRRQTPISHSFCRLVVATQEPLVVDDARRDVRVVDNPAIDALGIVAYLGVPLTLSTGFCLGSLCVIDGSPRRWTERERTILTDIASSVLTEVELRLELQRRALMQMELEVARDAALDASRVKTEFLTNMSHELRTPMNAIIGFAGLLAGADLPREETEWATTIERASSHLLDVLSNILDLAKLEAGKVSIEALPMNPEATVRDAVALFGPAAEAKGIVLCTHVAPDAPTLVAGDALRVRQVIVNLVGNAVKFTDAGTIDVYLRVHDLAEHQAMLEVTVSDTGIGVAPEALARLFDKFVQADGSTTRRHGGTGLGLAISRHLAEEMRGSLTARSEPGVGSTFTFRWTVAID